MRLIKCHIENYGKLTDRDFDFGSDITEICEENGYGKTTLASFVKAMFYGLPSVRVNSADFNDRKHFYPFNGGKFGGNIEFEMCGKTYRVERFFDRKSETDDTVAVFKNNKPTKELGKDIGKTVFGLDKESFERTSFITADVTELCATSGISAKLNNFVDNTSDENSYDRAMERLEKAKKKFKAAKGDNDLITKKQNEISELEAEIRDIKAVADTLDGYYSDAAKQAREISELEADIERTTAANISIERWAHYDDIVERKTTCKKALGEIEKRYPYGLPDKKELAELKSCNQKIIELGGQKTATAADDGRKDRLDSLGTMFADGAPDGDVIKSVQSDIDEVKRLDGEIAAQQRGTRSARHNELDVKFGGILPPGKEIAEAQARADKYRELDRNIKNDTSAYMTDVTPAFKNSKFFIIFAAISALIAAVGIGVMFANAIAGGIMLGVGLIGLGVVAFMYFKNRHAVMQTLRMSDGVIKMRAELADTEKELAAWLYRYGYSSGNGVLFDFASAKKDRDELAQLIEAEKAANERLKEMETRRAALIEKTEKFFDGYGMRGKDLQEMFIEFLNRVADLKNLQNEVELTNRGFDRIDAEIKSMYANAKFVLAAYKIPLWDDFSEQVESLDKSIAEFKRLGDEHEKLTAEAKEYKQKYELTVRPEVEHVDTAALSEKLSELRKELAATDGRIAEAENYTEQLDGKLNMFDVAKQTLAEYKETHKTYAAAIDMLAQAEQNLKDAYIAPIRDHFLVYANAIENALGEKISMDQDFRISFERGGENRSDMHLGAGQRSICALCFRLSLVDNMYKDEQPFIIMDDPFVNLDADHMGKTLQTVRELAKNKQIVYFCCHDSRSVMKNT